MLATIATVVLALAPWMPQQWMFCLICFRNIQGAKVSTTLAMVGTKWLRP